MSDTDETAREESVRFALRYAGPIDLMDIGGRTIAGKLYLKGTTTHDGTSETGAGHFDGIIWGQTLLETLTTVMATFGNQTLVTASLNTPLENLLAMLGESPHSQPLAADATRDALWAKLDEQVIDCFPDRRYRRPIEYGGFTYFGQVVQMQKKDFKPGEIYLWGKKANEILFAEMEKRGLSLGMNTLGWLPPDHPSRAGTHT